MIHKKQISQLARKIVRSQKGIRNHQLMHPSREWMFGLCAAAVFFTVSLVWSSTMYWQYKSENISMDTITDTQEVVYREALVAAALEIYAEKNARLLELLPWYQSGQTPGAQPMIELELSPDVDAAVGSSTQETATSTDAQEPVVGDSATQAEVATTTTQVPQEATEPQPANSEVTPSVIAI